MTPIHRLRTLGLMLSLLVALLSGCGIADELRVNDRSSDPIVSARVVHRIAGGNSGIELDYVRARAQGNQGIGDFDSVTLGGVRVPGPTTLRHTVTAQHGQLAYNHLLFKGRAMEMEWFAGVGVVDLDWVSTTPAQARVSRRHQWYGPAGGVMGRVNLGPYVALEARFSGSVRTQGASGSRTNAEAALALKPVPGVQLRLGMAQVESNFGYDGADSRLTMATRGPFAGLLLSF